MYEYRCGIVRAHNNLSLTYKEQGNTQKALEHLEIADQIAHHAASIDLQNHMEDAFGNLGLHISDLDTTILSIFSSSVHDQNNSLM